MSRYASFALCLCFLPAAGLTARAEEAGELIDPNVQTDPSKAVKVDRNGKVDEPDFKASVKIAPNPVPNFDSVTKGANPLTGARPAQPRNLWSVPAEEGQPQSTKSAEPARDENSERPVAEELSGSVSAALAQEKSGAAPEAMLGIYRGIVHAEPQNAAAHYRLGVALIRSSEPAKGLAEMEFAIALQPKNPKYLVDYGIAALRAGWVEKSFAACQEAVNLVPTNSRYLSALGDVHLAAGHINEAVEAYRRAVTIDPKNPAYVYNLGLACARGRDFKHAIDAFSQAIALKPTDTRFLCSRGLAYENLKDTKLALEDYQLALKLDKKDPYACYLYAGVFSDPDDPTYTNSFTAIDYAEKAVKLTHYKNAQYLMGLARALRVGRNYDQCVDVARKALELEPGREDYRRELATFQRLKSQGFDR